MRPKATIKKRAGAVVDRLMGDPSASALKLFKSKVKDLNNDTSKNIRTKKIEFLAEAKEQIPKLDLKDIIALYLAYKSELEASGQEEIKFHFIFTEDIKKPIGWIKHTIFKTKEPIGHTETHKQFLGLLKDRVLKIMQSLETKWLDGCEPRIRAQVDELMGVTRGRLLPNAFSSVGFGKEGVYKDYLAQLEKISEEEGVATAFPFSR